MKTAIHFGAGNIGRGFIGMLLSQAGYKVIFADVQETVVNALQEKNQYTVEVVGDQKQEILVENVTAMNSNDPALVDAIATADIVTTAVGPVVLKYIAPPIAQALAKAKEAGRTDSLSIIACENAVRATSQLKEYVLENFEADFKSELPAFAHFVDAAVDRIVPPMPADETNADVLKVRVEEFYEWLVEESAFQGDVPKIEGMTLVENLEAGVERKLFTLNTGHAVCAWVGQYLGFATIGEAIADEKVKAFVKAVMTQSGNALIKKHGFDNEAHFAYIEKILKRFANPYITDDVTRVGRQPVRKLTKGERIASPMSASLEFGLPADKLLVAAAAAMHFNSDEDPQVAELKELIAKDGINRTFENLSGIALADVGGADLEAIYNDLDAYLS
ncbi:MAG: mannitol-1-phosphate 5-dehydrogenase [Pseudomonadales bacterium]|nr:MAG: mannitol-1-phosphate 5-dehydrogenase [Pseudomonadales bacterium]